MDILKVSCARKGLDPRGEITAAHLKLRGVFGQVAIQKTGPYSSWELDIPGGGELYLDMPGGAEIHSSSTVYLINISTNHVGQKKKSLVLQRAQQPGIYHRIGLFGHWDWDKEATPEVQWGVAEITII